LLQHPEGPLLTIKRLKADTTDQVRDTIQSVFSSIRTDYGGCPFCALDNLTTLHQSYDPETLLKDHRVTRSLFGDLIEELSAGIMGVCHGCGLNLKIANGIVEHSPGRTCIYSALTRLICYEIFISGRLPACIRGMDLGFLNTDDIKSFGNWLKVHPLGESVNNLTTLLYNWVTLGLLQSPAGINDSAQTQREAMVDQGENETIRQPITQQRNTDLGRTDYPKTRDLAHVRSQVGLPGSSSLVQVSQHSGVTAGSVGKIWASWIRTIKEQFQGCPMCAISPQRLKHDQEDSFAERLRAHRLDPKEFTAFEANSRFSTHGLCYHCSLPNKDTAGMPDHQSRQCPYPRITRALCYVVWKRGTKDGYFEGLDASRVNVGDRESFARWLTGHLEGQPEHQSNMTRFAVNIMKTEMK
jgi:hypothetical protein